MTALPQSEGAEARSAGMVRARTLLAVMVVIGAAATLAVMFVLYRAALSQQKDRLQELVASEAERLATISRIDPAEGGRPEPASARISDPVAHPTKRWNASGAGVTILVVGQADNAIIAYADRGGSLSLGSRTLPEGFPAEVVEHALREPPGTVEYESPNGKGWLVAHERLDAMDGAVLARLDLDVLRRPLWQALWVGGLGSLILVALGVLVVRKSSVGWVDNLAQALARRVAAEAELQGHRDHLERTIEQRTRELARAQSELLSRERLATLGQITAKVSHELRNPLATLRASLFTLRERTKGAEPGLERILDRADRNVARCDRIIEELLSYTRPRTPRRDTFSLSELLEEVLSEYQPAAPVALEREIEPGVDLLADREDVRRMLINVLNNAVDATSERAEKGGAVRLVLERDAQQIVIRIEDNGVGMSEDVLSKAFEPLFSTKGFGVGLGLSIVRELAERNGCSITLTSQPDHGTRAELKFTSPAGHP